MVKYAVLRNPGHNRVYFGSAGKLAKNELAALFSKMPEICEVSDISEEVFGGVEYIVFAASKKLGDEALILVSRLSFVYAIFEVCEGGLFVPVAKNQSYYFGDDLNTILKYSGKTNEIFTRMQINLAVFASGFAPDFLENLCLLDPVCGKGTALFEALTCGYSAYGLDISKKSIDEAAVFFKKYLETGKYKHALKEEKISGVGTGGEAFRSQRRLFELSKNKADKKENKRLVCELLDGDMRNAAKYYKKNTFHIIAGDLAYGIQHENAAGQSKSRNPVELLRAALPGLKEVLKPKGAIALSWNLFLLERKKMEAIFEDNSFAIADFGDLSHRVDQSINRDLIIGVK